jgi:hypothetical protein
VTLDGQVILAEGPQLSPMVQIALDIDTRAGAMTKPGTYGWFFAGSAIVGAGARYVAINTKVDGPSYSYLERGNGRILQVRTWNVPLFRLDYHPMSGGAGDSQLHIHILPINGSEGLRFPIWW